LSATGAPAAVVNLVGSAMGYFPIQHTALDCPYRMTANSGPGWRYWPMNSFAGFDRIYRLPSLPAHSAAAPPSGLALRRENFWARHG
jgi:hypothetical protein